MADDTREGEGPWPPAHTSTPFFPALTTFCSLFPSLFLQFSGLGKLLLGQYGMELAANPREQQGTFGGELAI